MRQGLRAKIKDRQTLCGDLCAYETGPNGVATLAPPKSCERLCIEINLKHFRQCYMMKINLDLVIKLTFVPFHHVSVEFDLLK